MRVETSAGIAAGSENGGGEISKLPHLNPQLQRRLGDFATLTEGLDYAARGVTGFDFYSPRGALVETLTYADLRERALLTAKKLVNHGIKRGERVAIVAETGPQFMEVFFGCQYAGILPCPVPYAMSFGGKEAYVERIAGMLDSAKARLLVAPEEMIGLAEEAAAKADNVAVISHDELQAIDEAGAVTEPFRPDDVAYIQYSSGSTSSPKGVLISQKAITTNCRDIVQHGLKIREGDRAFSWLPLYHDMGLVGFFLSPMMSQVTTDYLATPSFARRPVLWLKLMSENGCTVSYSPSFGFDLAARRVNGEAANLDLSKWRVAGIGGDMVRPDVLNAFAEALAVAGFDCRAFLPSYGMAETTLAMTFADLDAPFRVDVVDKAAYKLKSKAVPASADAQRHPDKVRSFVLCGRPLPGHIMKVVDEAGRELGEREIGRVLIKNDSLMDGYFENREATRDVLLDSGFLETGDMGYMLDGQIVITGRKKDLILHNGRNIWPQDIEWAVEQIEPLRDGDVAAFAGDNDDGTDSVVVLVQCRLKDEAAIEDLRRQVALQVNRASSVECEVVMVPPKSLPFTSSGKLSRAGAKQRYMTGEIAEIAQGQPYAAELERVAAAG